MNIEKKIVEENKDYLLDVLETAPAVSTDFLGLRKKTIKDIFHTVVVESKYEYLPYCLYSIHEGTYDFDGKMIRNDEAFALSALKMLHHETSNRTASYFYAYGLRFDNQVSESVSILNQLANDNFSPAMLSTGDWQLKNGNVSEAEEFYNLASFHKHNQAWLRKRKLRSADGSILKRITLWCQMPKAVVRAIKNSIYSGEDSDIRYLYLDFQF